MPLSSQNSSDADPGKFTASFVRQALDEKKHWFEHAVAGGFDALEINRIHSDMTDRIVSSLFHSVEQRRDVSDRIAVLALGGYGRREMGLFCDIDLLFLHDSVSDDIMRKMAEGIFYPFWDGGAEIGGATRTIADCESIINEDVKALTAMIDARPVAGNSILYEELLRILRRHFARRKGRIGFIEDKLNERGSRLKRYGDSICLLQPNIKEGEGGLRDYHTLGWISRAMSLGKPEEESSGADILSERGRREVENAIGFLWRIRHILHIIEGKRSDRLSEGVQAEVAKRMKISSHGGISPTERLMSCYYRHAGAIHLQCARAMEKIRRSARPASRMTRLISKRRLADGIYKTAYGTLAIDAGFFPGDRTCGLRAFAIAKRCSLPLDVESKDLIAHIDKIDDPALSGAETSEIWREILSNFENIEKILLEMKECNYLEHWFPEMLPMLHLVQHDGFHIYTAGVHSIMAMGEIEGLIGEHGRGTYPTLRNAMGIVGRPHVLALATLFHDIGKGRGGGHADTGARLAAAIARRLGFSARDVEDVEFLVRSHLLMAKLAFRRDIHDPGLLERFAQSIRSPEMLAMLYVLTYADIKAIGPNVWTNWKAGLLADLYEHTCGALMEGGITIKRRQKDADGRKASIKRYLGECYSADDIELHLSALPERYLFSIPAKTIAAHIMMSKDLGNRPVATVNSVVEEMGCSEFSIITRDQPGLFAKIAGILSAGGANIVNAQLYTTSAGVAIDVLWLTDTQDRPFDDPERWMRIREDLELVILEKANADSVIGSRLKRRLLCVSRKSRTPNITIDNDVSAGETVVEIQADDRRGLLYTIASTFHELGLVIGRAKITTHVDRVIDVFYIRDSNGEKILSREKLEAIRRTLLKALGE